MEENKKRILVPIVGQGSITHIIRTGMLDKMKEFCNPVVAFLWKEEALFKELQQKGFEVVFIPPYSVTTAYSKVKSKINIWYLRYKLKTPSVNIQKKYLAQFKTTNFKKIIITRLQYFYHTFQFSFQPSYIANLLEKEKTIISREPVYAQFSQWLKESNISGLFTVTPFLPEVDLMARILRKDNIPVIASIHSFDNVTKRGWQSIVFDHYIVWNKYNKAELERIHPQLKKAGSISIAGAPQFDFHFDEKYTWSRDEWTKKLGLPADKMVILYSGGPVALLPNETQYLKAIKEAFDNGRIAKDVVVLFRCHPLDKVERWKKEVGDSPNIIYDSAPNGQIKLDQVNVSNDDIIKLISTLKHADIHINVVSTMAVDGSVFSKPQIGPYYDDMHSGKQELFRQMYFQEHYRPIMKSKVINLANSKVELINIINKAIENPADYSKNCNNCVNEIITFSDGRSTDRAVAAIKNFITNEDFACKS